MIYSVNIKNMALINEAQITFSDGFNVITGETGAGKSVLIGSINMLLGERMNKDVITTGAKEAEVSAVFYVEDKTVIDYIKSYDIDIDETGELVMSRQLHESGRNVCRINGKIVNVSTLKDLGRYLIDLHGQHNNQALLDKNAHITILDKFAENVIYPVLKEYKKTYEEMQTLKAELSEIEKESSEKERKIDILNFEINEIKSLCPKPFEDEELKKKKEIVNNFKNLCSAVGRAYGALYDDPEGRSAYQSAAAASMSLADAMKFDESLKEVAENIEEVVIKISESARELGSYLDNLENSVEFNFDIDARLDELYKLKRKYGGSIDAVLSHLKHCEEELLKINSSEERYNEVLLKFNKQTAKATELSQKLTELRKQTAEKIEKEICKNLEFLNMPDAKFEVSIEKRELCKNGADNVEFMLTTLTGAEPRPLNKIASGGELSRIMLAIKTVLAETDIVKTMIFDEIDTGVSGVAAQKIGEKIKELSKTKQIFCVTHLAQIASIADTHFLIEKTSDDSKTTATVKCLGDSGRVNELARIISGDKVTDTTIKQAQEMLGL